MQKLLVHRVAVFPIMKSWFGYFQGKTRIAAR